MGTETGLAAPAMAIRSDPDALGGMRTVFGCELVAFQVPAWPCGMPVA
jgi:hypothetical protein